MGGISSVAASKQYKKAEEDINMKEGSYEEIKRITREIKLKVKT